MSLDVELFRSNPDHETWQENKKRSLEEAGSMIGLIPMIEEYYDKREPHPREIVFERNITHNLNTMAGDAGIYKHLWRPEELNITTASQLIEPLTMGLKTLKEQPERFKKFNPKNGWGDYDGLVKFVSSYLEACKENPNCEIYISR